MIYQHRCNWLLKHAIIMVILISCAVFISCGDEGELVMPILDEQMPALAEEPVGGEDLDNAEAEKPMALPGLPDDVAGYETWLQLNAQPIPPNSEPRVAFDAHRGTKNVYVNQDRGTIAPNGEQQFPYPEGSIVVKESVRPNRDFVGLIAIMRKASGSNASHNDWTFAEYTRSGADAAFSEIASGAVCTGCHSGAANSDYVWTRLE
ncbi:MAG: cytochrome P460 family protein [Candidatus Poribacteria bacterium]|nr:cytochrome P460 family protein [Candidatus Poribacteria bacterium]